MSTGTLALIIAIAILAQIVAAVSIALWRRFGNRHDSRVTGSNIGDSQEQASAISPPRDRAAWEGFKPFRVAKRVQENAAGDILSFYLEPETPMTLAPFKPGQFLTLMFELPGQGHDAMRKVIRCYSLSDRPHPDHYRITVKRVPAPSGEPAVPPGLVSNHLHERVREGDILMVKPPSGHFHLIEEPALPLVLIAGGIGITPMLSILNTLLAQASGREIWLFYGVRNGREAIMHRTLLEMAQSHSRFHLHLCYSRADADDRAGVDYQHTGHVDVALLQQVLKLGRYQYYVCGPAVMMESIVPGLEALGIAVGDIHYEAFGPATLSRPKQVAEPALAEAADHWRVNFGRSGKSVEWNGTYDSLLSLAEAEGVDVVSGCRAGSCGSCQTRIEAGEVDYNQEPDADPEAGHCLLCISRPKSDLTLAV
ncbi:MAG: 2Fe-2S iron-sulfur cluster-binding protein [Candidatus Thiodiazotropha sp.]